MRYVFVRQEGQQHAKIRPLPLGVDNIILRRLLAFSYRMRRSTDV